MTRNSPTLLHATLVLHGLKKSDLQRESRLGRGTVDRLTSGRRQTEPHAGTLLMLTVALARLLDRPDLALEQVCALMKARVQSPMTMSDEVRAVIGDAPHGNLSRARLARSALFDSPPRETPSPPPPSEPEPVPVAPKSLGDLARERLAGLHRVKITGYS